MAFLRTIQKIILFLSPKAEDLNTLIGNAFRTAYAVQLSEERGTLAHGTSRRGHLDNGHFSSAANSPTAAKRELATSRSIESLLSATTNNPENCYEMTSFEEPLYETTDFAREQRVRMSDTTLSNRFQHQNGTLALREQARVSAMT